MLAMCFGLIVCGLCCLVFVLDYWLGVGSVAIVVC